VPSWKHIKGVQLGLFSPQLPEATSLDVTLARIRAIVCEENVGRAVLLDTHGPEGFRIEPFAVPTNDSSAVVTAPQRAAMRQPHPSETASVTLRDRRPTKFIFRGCLFTVERAYGPWRTSGDWWNQTLWGLEQWDVVARARDGEILCCCMVRDLMHNCWQIAGLYD